MDAATQASSLLSKLKNYDFTDIDILYHDLLQPFSSLISTTSLNPSKKSSRSRKPLSSSSSSSSIRSLAKTFLPFINQSLSLLPKLLDSPKHTSEFVSQLLECYKLCLDCLQAIASELSGKPYCVHLQRCRYLNCLMRCEKYEDAIDEGFRVLKDLGGIKLEGCGWKVSIGKLVPKLIEVDDNENGGVEDDFVQLVINLALAIAQSVTLSKVKDAGKYTGLLILLDEVRPWFRHLEANSCSKLPWKLLSHLKNAALFLVKEVAHFKSDLIPGFCAAVFDEYTRLLNARSHQGTPMEELEEYVRFILNCSYKCRSACKDARLSVAMHMYGSTGKFSQDLVFFIVLQRAYALGLHFSELSFEPNCLSSPSEGSKGTSSVGFSPEDWDKLQDLCALLRNGKKYFYSEFGDKPLSHDSKDFVEKASISARSDAKALKADKSTNGVAYLSFYLNALKFLCWSLAEFVTSESKRIVMENMESPLGFGLKLILEAFLEYSYLFPHCQQNRDLHIEIDMIVLSISVAAVSLSLKLNQSFEGSTRLINYILSDNCIPLLQPQMLKYIIAMLHNNFVEFYRLERLKEASEALELCCRASWRRCLFLSEILVGKHKGFDGDLSENMIAESVNEACKANSLLLDINYQNDSCDLEQVTVFGLETWCLSRNLLEQIPCPVKLMKKWAKRQCKLYKDSEGIAPILGNYLLCSPCMAKNNISLEIIGTILEQELIAYQEMSNLNPIFCQRMQREIIGILLQKVYLSSKCMRRSIILVKKGMLSRTAGIEGQDNCIQCLSEAIESINGTSGMTHGIADMYRAVVYSLRALVVHEANPTSKEMFKDIRKAINLWSRIDVPCCLSSDNGDMGCEYVLLLLYHVADLLSIKGDLTLYADVLNVIIKVYKQMNYPLGKCLLLLWKSRRVNHALCVVPTNEALISSLSQHYGKDADSLDFWISSLKDSQQICKDALCVGLQQNFSFLSSYFPLAFHQRNHFLISEISVDEVASNLISNGSVSRHSAFLAGYLYHDLSERLSAGGRTIEALFCAKEAHRLRGKLLQEHFSYSIQYNEANHRELGETIRKPSTCVSHFSVLSQAAIGAWPAIAISQGSDDIFLTPWNVLRCYLESTLQVGIIHERLGNVAEAEAQFVLGKSISCLQSLPQFIIKFSSCLGKVYHGLSLFDLTQKELETSLQVLAVERNSLTCSMCSLMLESSINEQLGNLCRKGFSSSGNPYESSLCNLICLEKDDLSNWLKGTSAEHSVLGEQVVIDAESSMRIDHECAGAISNNSLQSRPAKAKAKVKTEAKRSRKTKKELEATVAIKSCAVERNSTATRSRKLSSHANRAGYVKSAENGSNIYSNGQLASEVSVGSNLIICHKCFLSELKFDGSFTCFIQMKWEFVRRRQILRLLIGLGKCHSGLAETHIVHHIYSKCLSILLGGDDCHCSSFTPLELDSIGKEIPGDILVVERAEVFYRLCWFSLKSLDSENIRSKHCDLCCIQMSHVISFLQLSFVLSREVPLLFQKVSRLLALVYLVLASGNNMSSLSPSKVLSENFLKRAAYFHQASVGSHQNLQMLSTVTMKHGSQFESKGKGSEAAVATSMKVDKCTFLRMAPASTEDIKSYVTKFFESLPSTTIVCVSLLGPSYAGLLKDLMRCPSREYGWLLVSHLNSDSEPAVLLLPLNPIPQDDSSASCLVFGENNVQEWHSPWGCNALVDDVAPLFKLILRGNYLSCSSFSEEQTETSRKVWWSRRDNLDKCLCNLLRDMEETWFGQWKFLLLGRLLDTEPLNRVVKKFMHEKIKDGHTWVSNESILKVVMGGIKSTKKEKVRIPKLFLEKGCYIGSSNDCDCGRCNALDKEYEEADHVMGSLVAAVNEDELEYCTRREPVILVLDSDAQMLPLENMPIMREQEVYRMPSIASINMALQRRSVLDEATRLGAKFPLIDPLDAFYLLNPSGDLSRTQAEFEEWFRHQNMQGKAGIVPSTEELSAALENCDLFLYFGHGSGAQYMPRDKIHKLKSCAGLLLMGCSSGSLNLNGQYAPVGTSLSYMMAGAPIVVANLWEVTDLDIDRFAKAVLNSFLEERSMSSTGCTQCSLLAEELKSLNVNERKVITKKSRGKKKIVVDPTPDVTGEYCFKHKLRVGYFVSQARKACKLPFLIGAAPVCYGVPTGIRKKTDT